MGRLAYSMPWGALLAVGALATAASARPTADVVIVWAPGVDVGPVAAVARDAGAAVIDRSPRPAKALDTADIVRRGIAAYDALQLPDAAKLLDDARAAADRNGAAGLSQTELSDLFLYRALVDTQAGDTTGAWDELVTAVTVAPTRVLDPARFPPRVAAELERARATVAARAQAQLAVEAAPGCRVRVDGVDASGSAAYLVGPHWIAVTCPDREPWGMRFELSVDVSITARNAPLAAPSQDEMLIQARAANARAFLAIEVRDRIATVRLIGTDGRERDRRTATVTTTLAPLAPAVRTLLVPATDDAEPWYRSRWAWAAGAAIVVAAIAIPATIAATSDDTPNDATVSIGNPWRAP